MGVNVEEETYAGESIEYTTEELIELGKKRNVLKLAPPLYEDKQKETEQSEAKDLCILKFNHIAIAWAFTLWTQVLILIFDGITTATALYLFLACIVIQQVLCFLTYKVVSRKLNEI